jgi:UDP-N-acetylglucosamine 2-epimerase (non-hydrolysing)
MKKVLIVFGTRPEAIKMAPVIMQFQKKQQWFETKICVTSQHREMLDQVLEIYGIEPDYDLDVMKSNQDLFGLSGLILLKLRDVLTDFNPDIVLVHGDTTTSFTAALAAFYKKIPVAHVEAGLRSGNIASPWPEEMNRKLTSAIASFHFAPSILAKENLLAENVHPEHIYVTGNTVVDSLFMAVEKINSNKAVQNQIIQELDNALQGSSKNI